MTKFQGDFVYKQGRLDLAGGLQLARLSKCVVPDSELQGQLEQTCRLHLDLPLGSAEKRQARGHSPHPQAGPGTGPAYPPPPPFPPSFPTECSLHQGLKCDLRCCLS